MFIVTSKLFQVILLNPFPDWILLLVLCQVDPESHLAASTSIVLAAIPSSRPPAAPVLKAAALRTDRWTHAPGASG